MTADCEQHIRTGCAEIADEHDGAAADAVGQFSPDGREEKLHRRKRRDDRADDQAFLAERLAEIIFRVAGQQRQHDAEADQVNEDRQENDEE